MKNVDEYLEKLGFSPIEARIYLTLLKTGPMSVKDLAEKVQMNRTAIYSHLSALQEDALILYISINSKKLLVASEPDRLQYLIDKQIEKIKDLQIQFPAIVSTLEHTMDRNDDAIKFDVKYYRGKNGMKKIWDEMFQSENARLYAKLSETAHLFPDENDLFENALAKNPKLKIYEIYGDPYDVIKKYSYKAKSPRYFYKFMPMKVGLTSPGILMFNNKVAIVNAGEKISGTVLYNKNYYINSTKLFDYIWQTLPAPQI